MRDPSPQPPALPDHSGLALTLLLGLLVALPRPSAADPTGFASAEARPTLEARVAAEETTTEVLTLEEAALWLRVTPAQLEASASAGELPGRRLGEHWRFSRSALHSWLEAPRRSQQASSCAPHPPPPDPDPARAARSTRSEPAPADAILVESELAAVTGRGPDTGTTPAPARGPERAGEPPASLTTEQVFLRRTRVLLGRGQFIIEPSIGYARGEDVQIRGFHLEFAGGTLDVPQLFLQKEDTTAAALSVRYGLLDETELYALARYRFRNPTESSHRGGTGAAPIASGDREVSSHLARLTLGARHTLLKERSGRPDLVASIEAAFPLHDTSYAIGAGLWAVKSYDPISLFAGVEYRHVFSRQFSEPSRLEPENIGGLSAGYAFAVNDQLTLSTAVLASFSSRTAFDSGLVMQNAQSYGLRLGLTHRLRKGLYLDPNVTIGLNGPGSWVRFGLNVPFTLE